MLFWVVRTFLFLVTVFYVFFSLKFIKKFKNLEKIILTDLTEVRSDSNFRTLFLCDVGWQSLIQWVKNMILFTISSPKKLMIFGEFNLILVFVFIKQKNSNLKWSLEQLMDYRLVLFFDSVKIILCEFVYEIKWDLVTRLMNH